MAYNKTLWKDRVVERPNTYRIVENTDGTITLYPATGQVIEKGTPVSATNLNKLENGIVEVYKELDNIANKGTTVAVLERVTKQEIDRQIADGTIANLTIANGSITKEKLDPNIKFGVEDGGVTSEKIAKNAVGIDKINFATGNVNVITYKDGFRIIQNGDNGYSADKFSLVEDKTKTTTNAIEIKNADADWLFKYVHRIAFFDASNKILGYLGNLQNTQVNIAKQYAILQNTKYIVVSVDISNKNNWDISINGNTIKENNFYFPNLSLAEKQMQQVNECMSDFLIDKFGYASAKAVELGIKYYGNAIVNDDNYFITPKIPVQYLDIIKVPTLDEESRCNVYDVNDTYLGGWGNLRINTILTINHNLFVNCAYVRISAPINMLNKFHVTVNNKNINFDSNKFTLDKLVLTAEQIGNILDKPITGINLNITDVLNKGGVVKLGKGTFILDNVILPDNTIVRGECENTIVKYNDSCAGDMLKMGNNCDIADLVFDGGNRTHPTVDTQEGDRTGLSINNKKRCKLRNLRATGFSKHGLYATEIGYNHEHHQNLKIDNCDFEYNFLGILLDRRAEYAQLNNVNCGNNFLGCLNRGGNNSFSNSMFNSNVHGFMIQGGANYPNHGHSSASNCTFNHNLESGIIAKDVTIGYIFAGCQLFDGDLVLENSEGIWFTGGELGTFKVVVKGGRYNLIKDNFLYTRPSKDIQGGMTAFENNRLADGSICTI